MSNVGISLEIDACAYLYLREVREPDDNKLVIILDEAIAEPGAATTVHGISNVRPIVVGPNSRAFELSWESYVAYDVRNESFAQQAAEDIVSSGRLLRVYQNSNYLNYLAKMTWADASFPGPLTHVGILCLNHIIDVAAVGYPQIKSLPR